MAKYSVQDYAKAFAAAAKGKEPQNRLVKNFLEIVIRNGDASKLPKILTAAERLVRQDAGLRKLTIETARPLAPDLRKKLAGLGRKNDVVEEKVVPELVAGVRLTENEERQFDATLARKLQKMFA